MISVKLMGDIGFLQETENFRELVFIIVFCDRNHRLFQDSRHKFVSKISLNFSSMSKLISK